MLKVEKFKGTNNPLIEGVFAVRRKVFIEEQKVAEYEEFDEFEDASEHFALLIEQEVVATARIRETEEGIKLERFAVLFPERGKGYGAQILEATLKSAKSFNKKIYLNAQVSAVQFYEKFNFAKTGPLFVECDIEHYKMEFKKE